MYGYHHSNNFGGVTNKNNNNNHEYEDNHHRCHEHQQKLLNLQHQQSIYDKLTWKNILIFSHLILFILSILYFMIVFLSVAETCYVIPCYKGPGLEPLWKVNKGVTFIAKSSVWFSLFHSMLGLYLFFNKNQSDKRTRRRSVRKGLQNNVVNANNSDTNSSHNDFKSGGYDDYDDNNGDDDLTFVRDAHFVIGLYIGITLCSSMLMLNMIWIWGSEWNLLNNMTRLNVNNKVFEESGRHMVVNKQLIVTFYRLYYTSMALCTIQLLVVIQLVTIRKDFITYFHLHGGTTSSNTSMASSGATISPRTGSSIDETTPLQIDVT